MDAEIEDTISTMVSSSQARITEAVTTNLGISHVGNETKATTTVQGFVC